MSYLIDTHVLSELRRKSPDPAVARWFADRPAGTLYLSVLTLGELRKGVERLADPVRRLALLDWLETGFRPSSLAVCWRWTPPWPTAGANFRHVPAAPCQPLTACWPPPPCTTA